MLYLFLFLVDELFVVMQMVQIHILWLFLLLPNLNNHLAVGLYQLLEILLF